jgi:hypothetical protein
MSGSSLDFPLAFPQHGHWLGQNNFPILLFNDTLSSSQVKGGGLVCAPGAPFDKEVFAVTGR